MASSIAMLFQAISVVVLLLNMSVFVARAENCTAKCTACATDREVSSGKVVFDVVECTQQCGQGLEDAPMWDLCQSMAVWTDPRMEDPSEELTQTLKWQHVMAIVVCVVLIVFCVAAAVMVYCVGCRNRSKPEKPRRWSYSREPSTTDEVNTSHPV
ncbi:uncharacterized protein LOC144906201 [Branchiostoma floridae x Branchiostoma belcheri]